MDGWMVGVAVVEIKQEQQMEEQNSCSCRNASSRMKQGEEDTAEAREISSPAPFPLRQSVTDRQGMVCERVARASSNCMDRGGSK